METPHLGSNPSPQWQNSRLPPRISAADQIVKDLKDQILSGDVPRGSKLPTEKELCAMYGVSAITVRAATRSLATMNLIEVRHGSGSFVTAESDQLVSAALLSMIRIDKVTAPEILIVLGSLNGFAAELAAANAKPDDITNMRQALQEIEQATDIQASAEGLIRFLNTLAEGSGNALLTSLCHFLSGLQVNLARELSDGSFQEWSRLTRSLSSERSLILDRIIENDGPGAHAAAVAYHNRARQMISALPIAARAVALTELSTPLSSGLHISRR